MNIDNYQIAEQFSLLSKLMDIHGENEFKSRAYGAAAFNIERLTEQLYSITPDKRTSLKGISSSIAEKINEILETGQLQALLDILAITPVGVIELLQIKGLGPKKIAIIWKEMHIESVGELLYACNENRLTHYKGFGAKTQENIQESIIFYLSQQGHFLYSEIHAIFSDIQNYLVRNFGEKSVSVTGAYRRQDLTIEILEFVIAQPLEKIKPIFQTAQPPEILEETTDSIRYKLKNGLQLKIYAATNSFAKVLFETTASEEFLKAFTQLFPNYPSTNPTTEIEIFELFEITQIPPYLRSNDHFLKSVLQKQMLPNVIQPTDIKGIIHSHSNWSDGAETIEVMAKACISKGFEYLVISDHSKSAQYAGGLSEEKIIAQHQYINELNAQLTPFKIYKSIECDILSDGSLDYADDILKSFDLVIASVHSNLKMNEEKAMHRLIKAIEHPATRILGHMTGRLLLSRNGYPIDHHKIIDACAANNVVIELNAHPRRLDIDWKWIPYALEKNVLISINPDAHSIEGFDDCKYGVWAAQKGGLEASQNLSSYSKEAFEKFLSLKK